MERFGGGDYPQPPPPPDYMYPPPPINHQNFPPNFHHHHPPDFHHRNNPSPNFPNQNSDHSTHVGEVFDNIPNRNSLPFSGRKRPFSQSGQVPSTGMIPDCPEGGNFVKLYVVGFPRTIPEAEVRSIFGEYGHVLEVVLLKDKRTGQQGECGFVKYSKLEEADRAVEALNDKYTFSGAPLPVKVRYADKERERLGILLGEHVHKLYVGCLNRQASKFEIEDVCCMIFIKFWHTDFNSSNTFLYIFSPYGIVEDVFIVRNEMMQSRGYAFVRFPRRDMAVAAINALNGTYTMSRL
ncbi:hypothetical protein Leryth_004872 [Lithospermum erythrorhizon]|nr:hypothetical protein Leryth_004872 [Lithospermum erythrorhizon]